MVDQLIYRLNRVPDLNYVKFLELIGVELRPPAAATRAGDVLAVRAAAAARAGARRDPGGHAAHRHPRPGRLLDAARARASCRARSPAPGTALVGAEPVDLTAALSGDQGFAAFSPTPTPGDALLIGLSNAVPSCAVTLRMECTVAGVGVDPRRPPRVWEAWTGTGWTACEVDHDDTGGLNKDGDVVLHVPDDAPDLDHRPGAGRLAALPAGRAAARPADVHRTAPGQRDHGVHDRWHGADGATPRCCTARRSASPTAPRRSGSRCCGARCWPPPAPARSRCGRRGRRRSGPRSAQFAESGPERPALPPRPRRRRGAVRAGGPAGRRHAAPLRRRAAPRRRRCC